MNLLPELPLEGPVGCVDADGVSPLSQTASLVGEGRAAEYSAIRVVPQRVIYDLCLFLGRDKGPFWFYGAKIEQRKLRSPIGEWR